MFPMFFFSFSFCLHFLSAAKVGQIFVSKVGRGKVGRGQRGQRKSVGTVAEAEFFEDSTVCRLTIFDDQNSEANLP